MTKEERSAVEHVIRSIYATWHMCRLTPKEAKQMKLRAGRLCDSCEETVAAHMKDLPSTSPVDKPVLLSASMADDLLDAAHSYVCEHSIPEKWSAEFAALRAIANGQVVCVPAGQQTDNGTPDHASGVTTDKRSPKNADLVASQPSHLKQALEKLLFWLPARAADEWEPSWKVVYDFCQSHPNAAEQERAEFENWLENEFPDDHYPFSRYDMYECWKTARGTR